MFGMAVLMSMLANAPVFSEFVVAHMDLDRPIASFDQFINRPVQENLDWLKLQKQKVKEATAPFRKGRRPLPQS